MFRVEDMNPFPGMIYQSSFLEIYPEGKINYMCAVSQEEGAVLLRCQSVYGHLTLPEYNSFD